LDPREQNLSSTSTQGDDIMKSELEYDISFDVSSDSDFDLNHAAAKGSDPSEN
jgi:hypothetical protein